MEIVNEIIESFRGFIDNIEIVQEGEKDILFLPVSGPNKVRVEISSDSVYDMVYKEFSKKGLVWEGLVQFINSVSDLIGTQERTDDYVYFHTPWSESFSSVIKATNPILGTYEVLFISKDYSTVFSGDYENCREGILFLSSETNLSITKKYNSLLYSLVPLMKEDHYFFVPVLTMLKERRLLHMGNLLLHFDKDYKIIDSIDVLNSSLCVIDISMESDWSCIVEKIRQSLPDNSLPRQFPWMDSILLGKSLNHYFSIDLGNWYYLISSTLTESWWIVRFERSDHIVSLDFMGKRTEWNNPDQFSNLVCVLC